MVKLLTATTPFLSVSRPFTKTAQYQQCCASPFNPPEPDSSPPSQPLSSQQKRKKTVDSTDWVASSLTRRFGLGAGLGWAGFLAFGVVSEQIKTRMEVSQEAANSRDVEEVKEIVLPNGIRYYDLRVGGGAIPRPGDLVVIDLKGQVQGTGQVFVDTFKKQRQEEAIGTCAGFKTI